MTTILRLIFIKIKTIVGDVYYTMQKVLGVFLEQNGIYSEHALDSNRVNGNFITHVDYLCH